MAQRLDDRWLWLGAGVATFAIVKGIQYALTDLVRLTKIDPYQFERKKKKEDHPEDALTVADLKVLADSPHPNIANAATSLVISRLARLPHFTQMITKDLASADPDTAQRARRAVHFMGSNVPMDIHSLQLPLAPPGYRSPTGWSDAPSVLDDDDGRISPLAALRDELVGESETIVPSIENPVAGWENVPRERGLFGNGGDGDDVETRRRRREAMVLHEGGGSVTRNDIFRPQHTG